MYTHERTIGGILARRGAEQAEREVVRFEDASVTYGELDDRASRLANAMHGLGLRKGDTVAVQLPNSPASLTVWFGLARAGIIEVPLNIWLRGDLLTHALREADCKAIIIAEQWLPRVEAVAADLDRMPRIIVVGTDTALPIRDLLAFDELLSAEPTPPSVAIEPGDTAVIIFTSGTTGPSKGVALSHNANFETAITIAAVSEYAENERLFTAFPMYHTNARYASILVGMWLDAGSTVVHQRFSASRFWDICRAEKATAFNFMGALLLMLAKQPARASDSAHLVRKAWGAPAPAEIVPDFEKRFGVTLLEGYGMTETGTATSNRISDRKLGSCGKAIPEYEIEIHDEHDNPMPIGDVGEIVVRPRKPNVILQGYYHQPEATLQAFRNLWFHTGDRGRQDADGWFYFVDRAKDSIRRRGENVSSWEVETVINGHPAVAESAVIGVPSDLSEEEILCVVRLKDELHLAPERLLDYAQERLPHFAVPRYIRFVVALPKNEQQRIQKFVLREAGVAEDTWDRESVGYVVNRDL
jgi:carnitine-CoA ligase